MKSRTAGFVAGIAAAGAILAGCGGGSGAAPAAESSAPWAPAGYHEVGDLAFQFMDSEEFHCKSYQDNCFGVRVTSKVACPSGIYIEAAVTKPDGTIVGKANDITPAMSSGDVVESLLAQPGGSPQGARAKLSKLNCLR